MKKGFLLVPERKVTRDRDATSYSTSDIQPTNNARQNGESRRRRQQQQQQQQRQQNDPQPMIIKKGFLLGPSIPASSRSNSGTLPPNDLPQCRRNDGRSATATTRNSTRPTRVITKSSALLDTSFSEDWGGASTEVDGYNHHQYPPAATTSTSTSSLLHFVRDDDDDDTASDNTNEGGEHNNPHHASTNTTTVELLHQHERQDGHTTINPSLDSWIEEPVSVPSHYYSPRPPPSIILPSFSTNHQSCSSQRAPRISKQQKPLIVEMDDAPITRGATGTYTNTNITLSVTDRTNAAVEPYCLLDHEINSNVEQIIDATTYQQQQQTTNVPTPHDIQQFTNTVSIFLSKLGRSIHSSSSKTNHPNNSQQHDETRDVSVIGLGTVVNTRTEALVQSFMTRHYLSGTTTTKRELLDNVLWKIILEPIAQDYTEFIHSRKNYRTNKKRSSSRSTTNCISPSLTLGLGMLQFHTPMGVAYDSLLRLLQRFVLPPHMEMSNNAGSNQDSQLKQQKILALGAIYLLRCRIRCINLSLTHLETGFVVVVDASHSDSPKVSRRRQTTLNTLEPELAILLSKLLPCLESIVSGSSASSTNGQTVLNSAAADACFELIEISSRFALCHHQRLPNNPSGTNNEAENVITDSMTIWNGVVPCIERLLMTKQRWIMSSAMSDRCATAVIVDWIDVLTSAKRLYFDYLVGDGLLEGCDCSAAMNLFVNLSGILMRRADEEDDSTKMTYLRVGGIVQSLCQHKECIFGSISSPIYGSDIDVVSLLQESSKLTDDIRARNKDSTSVDTFTIINHQRAAVRAFASWISSSTKAIRILTESKRNTEADVDLLDSSMGSLILMLSSESKQCVDLCIASLSTVWSACPDSMPSSFDDLLDALHAHSTQSFHENGSQSTQSHNDVLVLSPTCRALCMIVAKAASREPTVLLPSILKLKDRVELMIEVVLNMLEMLSNCSSTEDANYSVYHAATDILLENIASVPYLRSRIRSSPSLFVSFPSDVIIPKIVGHLVDQYAKRQSDAGVSSLSGVLCNIMKANVEKGRAEEFMRCVVLLLQNIDVKETNPVSEATTTFFNQNGPVWRLTLCGNASTSDSSYKELLLAVARAMLAMPASSTPLAALASLVDDQFDGRPSTHDASVRIERRIFIATSSIIQLSINELSSPCVKDEQDIFSRLAPILILRRLPRSYYRTVHNRLSLDNGTRDAMARLASILADDLKTLVVKDSPSSLYTEQKRLIAELLGHCLPLTSSINGSCCSSDGLHVSLYNNLCRDNFSDILKSLRVEQDNTMKFDVDNIRICNVSEAKAALYAVCHHIPLALDKDDGEDLINVASFAFEVLNCQPMDAGGTISSQTMHELTMMQSGCSHFLAVCVDSLSYRKASSIETGHATPLIVDIMDIQGMSRDFHSRNTIIGALLQIFHTLISIIRTGESNTGDNHTTTFLPSCRTAMLNSIVMLVQGSKADDTRIHWLASNMLPPLVEWTSKGPIDEDIHHPLCLAASLQVIYTVLARCGSFGWLSGTTHQGSISVSETDFVCRTLQCALTSFHTSGAIDSPVLTTLRLAALKVILTVLALHQSKDMEHAEHGQKGYLSPLEIQKATSAMLGAANVDQNPDIRRLANQILPHIIRM